MTKPIAGRVRALPTSEKIALAAARLCKDQENGNLTGLRVTLEALGPVALNVLLEMSNSMTGEQRAELARSLYSGLHELNSLKAANLRILDTLADLQIDASRP